MIAIFQQLLSLTSRLMSYYVDLIKYLSDELKTVLKYSIPSHSSMGPATVPAPPPIETINNYIALINKYKLQMNLLTNCNHVQQIYARLLLIITPGLTEIRNHINTLFALPQPLLKASIVGIFIRTGVEEKVKFLIEENKKPLDRFDNDANRAQDYLDKLNNDITNIPPSSYIIQSVTRFVEELLQEYTLDVPLIEIAMDKLHINYKEEKKLDKLKNSILQRIIEIEVDTSSLSFTESEVKTIDLMEYLTAHIDFIKRLLPLYIRFDRLFRQKLKIDELPVPQAVEIEPLLLQIINPFIENLVIGGTVGLSTEMNYITVFNFVQDLAIELITIKRTYDGFIPKNRPGRYSDDDAFWTTTQSYVENVLRMTYFLQSTSKGNHDISLIMGDLKEEFERFENEAREDFFSLLSFQEIFECDERIVKYQLKKKADKSKSK
ncbi:hypothetical protein Cantr_00693 [Candida viswanathii]|uniref:Uncharacterized protein n=1 Tax=Candida viswanathii TaxID=5486 RepID=A0A367YI30_9ASCO|nr:hypothetical protein Cantr_00693 [Candida viswanathii]